MKLSKLFVIALLAGTLGVFGCSDDPETGNGGGGGTAGSGGSAGNGGTAGSGGSAGTRGAAGSGGTAGNGGTGGTPPPGAPCVDQPEACDDHSDCTVNTCDPAVGCEETIVADGAPCAGGMCQAGQCTLSGTVFPCTAQGIHNAIAIGGGPYTFDCDGPTTVGAQDTFRVGKDVILDGEGNLTVDGSFRRGAPSQGSLELRGFGIEGEIDTGQSVTLVDSKVGSSGSIFNNLGPGVVLMNSTVWGAVYNRDTLIMTNSTLSGGSISHSGTVATIINSTLSGGGCLINVETQATIANSVIEGLCCGYVTSNGYNIESPGDTCGFDQPTDQVNVSADDLKLGPLQGNGGPTETHALLPGSVAIDVIPQADCVDAEGEPLTEDQRGLPRPETGGTMCDVGAFEVQPEP